MQQRDADSFQLENFEGPLDLLWHLIHREEIDIYEVPIYSLVRQYINKLSDIPSNDVKHIDIGADFIGWAAALVWYKSKTLLPKHEQLLDLPESLEEADPRFDIIHQLLDYCRFKQAAKMLADREEKQSAFYVRGSDTPEAQKKYLGINHLSLHDLSALFQQLLTKAASKRGTVHEETWKVSDKISELRQLLMNEEQVLFTELFTPEKSRDEWIVTFLALLELMKMGEARVGQLESSLEIVIFPG